MVTRWTEVVMDCFLYSRARHDSEKRHKLMEMHMLCCGGGARFITSFLHFLGYEERWSLDGQAWGFYWNCWLNDVSLTALDGSSPNIIAWVENAVLWWWWWLSLAGSEKWRLKHPWDPLVAKGGSEKFVMCLPMSLLICQSYEIPNFTLIQMDATLFQ